MNANGATDLVGTTSSTSFTWPATFGRRHHSLPYSIFCDFQHELHSNGIFFRRLLNRSPKIRILFVLKLWTLISSSNQVFFEHVKVPYYSLQKKIPTMYWMPYLEIIWPLLWKDLWLGVKFPIWFPSSLF